MDSFGQFTPRRLRVRTLIIPVSVSQAGIVAVQEVQLPPNVVRVIGVMTTNVITDQKLHTNLYFFGTGPVPAGGGLNEAYLLAQLGRALLVDGFRYVDVSSAAAATTVFASPTRLGAPSFRTESGAVLDFVKRGEVVVNDAELGVSEPFAVYESVAASAGARRVWVRGLNTTGRAVIETAVIQPPSN